MSLPRRILLSAIAFCLPLASQTSRIPSSIDSRQSVVLRGHVRPQARPENDRGAVAASFPVHGMTLILKPSTAQSAALQQLLAQQQDPASPKYHQWLTPEQYADAYGVSTTDLNRIAEWLKSQGFTVDSTARSRLYITFSGTADQVAGAFHTQIHHYLVNGQMHYANATDPSIPAALTGIVSSIRGLTDFRLKPRIKAAHPDMTSGGTHHIAPDDFATIYNVAPLYQAGVDGTGQTIAVVGQTKVNLSDIQQFRSKFNLSTPNLKLLLVPGSANPGISSGDLPEADLDIEWSGAIARNAQIVYVYSSDVITSLMYAIDQNVAPVLSMSYGGCEPADLVDLPSYQQLAQQGNAQGMTWVTAAGDSGAADCEDPGATIAQDGLAADAPGVIPEVTSMGGTTFNDSGGSYWAAANTANSASALSYIPETVWNDTSASNGLAAGGGGASIFFPQPAWQTAAGVPNDGARHVPDLALSSSAEHDGYYVYTNGAAAYFGGTSVAAPTMSGIVALLNQYLSSTGQQPHAGLGNINPQLYRLSQTTPGIFHDITTGNNSVPCVAGSPNCNSGSFGNSAGPGYDSATGLGSVDAFNLLHGWSSKPPVNSAVMVSIDQNPVFQQAPDAAGNGWRFTLTVTEEGGIPTTVTGLTIDGTDFTSKIPALFGATALTANGSLSANIGLSNLAVPKNVVMVVSGVDASGVTWSQQLSILFTGPQIPLTIGGISNAASGQQVFAPGMIMSVYGTQLGNFAQAFGTVPLPLYLAGFEAYVNGVSAPLYYVSPNQVNIQIPYETQPGQTTLTVGNPYINVDYNFTVVASAPGIFTAVNGSLVPFSSAARNQTITLYLTGDGQVSPSLATGTAPSANTSLTRLPKPQLAASVTVGGVSATITFIGIPPGYVGVTQVNFTVPPGAPTGVQPVVVTIGATSSAPANLTVQ